MQREEAFAAWYVTAFLDVLGTRDALPPLPPAPGPLTSDQMRACTDSLFQSYEVVTLVRDGIQKHFESFGSTSTVLETIPPNKRDLFIRMRQSDIKYRFFSDSITIFQCLRTDRLLVPMGPIFGMLGACGAAQLEGVATGHPIRGGIEIGLGIEIDSTEIYGQTLVEAYNLESKVAFYPRIVVGKRLMKWIGLVSESQGTDEPSALNKVLASTCLSLVRSDVDGVTVLDFLGSGFVQHVSRGLGADTYAAIVAQLDRNLARFEDSYSSAYKKWSYLKSYFMQRQDLWKPRPNQAL